MSAMAMTTKQIRSAHALAAAHGHDWARISVAAYVAAMGHGVQAGELYAAAVEAEYAAARDAGYNTQFIGGIAPSPSRTTGSGRVAWRIRQDGTAEVAVCRPDPRRAAGSWDGVSVLELLISPKGEILVARSAAGPVVAEVRHVHVAAEVVAALGGDGRAEAVVAATGDPFLAARLAADEEARAAGLAAFEAAVAAGQDGYTAQRAKEDHVYPASLRARYAVAKAAAAASPGAEERRYQAARREALERAGVSL